MEGLKLLEHWKKFVDIAIQETWLAFHGENDLFLTENDVKCYLYSKLRKIIKIQPYAVHSEVTHYAAHQNRGGYRFRDLVLLNPQKLWNNAFDDPPDGHAGFKSKGFSHIGESIFFEIKFQRNLGIRINENDLANLTSYRYNDGENHENPKYAIIVWSSKHVYNGQNDLPNQMMIALNHFSERVHRIHIPFKHVFGFVFNQNELHEFKWEDREDEGNWIENRIV